MREPRWDGGREGGREKEKEEEKGAYRDANKKPICKVKDRCKWYLSTKGDSQYRVSDTSLYLQFNTEVITWQCTISIFRVHGCFAWTPSRLIRTASYLKSYDILSIATICSFILWVLTFCMHLSLTSRIWVNGRVVAIPYFFSSSFRGSSSLPIPRQEQSGAYVGMHVPFMGTQ